MSLRDRARGLVPWESDGDELESKVSNERLPGRKVEKRYDINNYSKNSRMH